MRKIGLIITLVCLVMTLSSSARGAEMPIVYTAPPINLNATNPTLLDLLNKNKVVYADSPITKASDGVLNMVSAWVDIPASINDEAQDTNLFFGLTIGLGKGLISGFTREAAGVVDVATCGFPPYNKPLVEPEYRVDYPERDGLRLTILSW